MAVDVFVMPLTRYFSGDYITPAMRAAWDLGAAYTLVTPEGRMEIPAGQSLGGPDAARLRQQMIPDAAGFFSAARAAFTDEPWDEADDSEIGAWRHDPRSFDALLQQVDAELGHTPGLLGRVLGKRGHAPHLAYAQLFLPVTFETVFLYGEEPMGSLPVLVRELTQVRPHDGSSAAHALMTTAAAEATRRRLPLIIDT